MTFCTQITTAEPNPSCSLCPRLANFRDENTILHPDWFNGAVPSFGDDEAEFLIVGLAPGLRGAHRTGRPFTGDHAGDLLYATLLEHGWACGEYKARADDGLLLNNCMITNSVRCVPPANKPTTQEIKTCRGYLEARIAALPNLKVMLALGRVAHDSVLSIFNVRKSTHPFVHGAQHRLSDAYVLFDSFHCSRYNTNTRRLTPEMFSSVFVDIASYLSRT